MAIDKYFYKNCIENNNVRIKKNNKYYCNSVYKFSDL